MTQLVQSDDMSLGETLRVFGRALRYVRPFRGRVAIKLALTVIALIPTFFLGIPVKVIVDHVVLAMPIDQLFANDWVDALLAPLGALSREEVLYWMVGIQLALVFLVGMFGSSGAQRDIAQGDLANGQDDATRSENEANRGWSLAGGLFGLLDFRFMLRLTQDLNHHYRSSLFQRIQTLPMTLIDDERIGDAVYRVMYDTPTITNVAYRVLVSPLAATLQVLAQVTLLLLLFPEQTRLVWIAASFLPLALLVTLPFSGALRRTGLRSRGAGARTTATLEEGMSNILAVQSLGANERESQRFQADSWAAFGRFRVFVMVRIAVIAAGTLFGALLAAYAFLVITDEVMAGALTPGDFGLLFNLFVQVLVSAATFGWLWVDLQSSAPGIRRVFFLMDQPCEEDPYGARTLPRIRRGLELGHVDFDYPDGTPALRGIQLQLPVGRVTALCGPAGAGKTTLAYLIPRFLSPTRGVVRADGIDIERVTLASLRAQVAFVFQENALFDASVADNIRMGNPEASDTDVRRAARTAGADEFIRHLPQGYDTRLGRGGGKLSVGQKQRLSIARALVRDSAVLVLDEPTSALDPETELRLVAALREASRERAVVVIAHRLSTIRSADQIVFLEQGRILERGTHAELMRSRGSYARFVELQTRGVA